MATPYGRQSLKSWEDLRNWEKEITRKLTYNQASGIRYRFPHDNCTHDNCCENCRSLIENIVKAAREHYEEYLGNKLSELINIRCPFPHDGD